MAAPTPANIVITSYLNAARDSISDDTHLWTQAPNADGPSDKTVAVVKFATPSGEPIAAYVNYAMHPINGYALASKSGVKITGYELAGETARKRQALDWVCGGREPVATAV